MIYKYQRHINFHLPYYKPACRERERILNDISLKKSVCKTFCLNKKQEMINVGSICNSYPQLCLHIYFHKVCIMLALRKKRMFIDERKETFLDRCEENSKKLSSSLPTSITETAIFQKLEKRKCVAIFLPFSCCCCHRHGKKPFKKVHYLYREGIRNSFSLGVPELKKSGNH